MTEGDDIEDINVASAMEAINDADAVAGAEEVAVVVLAMQDPR